MVRRLYGGRPRGVRVDTELAEEFGAGAEDLEPKVRTGELDIRDVNYPACTYPAGWLSQNGLAPHFSYTLDADPSTYIENVAGGAGTLSMKLKEPRMIARVYAGGSFNNVAISVWNIETQAYVTVLDLLADPTVRTGISSPNFTPIVTDEIRFTFAPAATAERIVSVGVLTVTEIKGSISITPTPPDPANPQFSQLMQQVVNSEATVTSDLPGDPTVILDKDKTTSIGPGAGLTTISLNSPKLVARVSIIGTGLAAGGVTVTLFDVNQTPHSLIPTAVNDVGWESGNLNPYINTDRVEINCTGPITIAEVTIYKAIEVKIPPVEVVVPPPVIETSPANPLFGQLQQQIVLPGDVNEAESIAQSTLIGGTIPDVLDKDNTTFATIGGGGVLSLIFTHSKQIARVQVVQPETSPPVYEFTVEYRDGRYIWHTLFTSTLDEPRDDSDNFEPVMATGVRVISTGETPLEIAEVIILKSIEAKVAFNLNMVPSVEVIKYEGVEPGNPVGSGNTTGPFPSNLAGQGVYIGKDNNLAINAEVRITGTGVETLIDCNLLWYYSEDDVTYHYFATTPLVDTPGNLPTGNPNPTGYQAPGGTSFRQISHPLTAYSGYVAVVFSNDNTTDPPPNSLVTVVVNLVRQR